LKSVEQIPAVKKRKYLILLIIDPMMRANLQILTPLTLKLTKYQQCYVLIARSHVQIH